MSLDPNNFEDDFRDELEHSNWQAVVVLGIVGISVLGMFIGAACLLVNEFAGGGGNRIADQAAVPSAVETPVVPVQPPQHHQPTPPADVTVADAPVLTAEAGATSEQMPDTDRSPSLAEPTLDPATAIAAASVDRPVPATTQAPASNSPAVDTTAPADSTAPDPATASPGTTVASATPETRSAPAGPMPAAIGEAAGTTINTAAASQLPASSSQNTPLQYRWKTGDIVAYRVTMEADRGGELAKTTGTVELTIGRPVPRPKENGSERQQAIETGTGSGFAVTGDGHFITCAHVVQGATTIELTIGGKKYPAQVIDVSPVDDLALVKIEATGLQPIALADSSRVRLGEEVRVVGFPLASVLGDGIKVTRGTVAGIVEKTTGRRFQVDAAINPGNSGGPVVNQRGSVLGVASSKLVGVELTALGFCVPTERVEALLARNSVKSGGTLGQTDLDGPSLVTAVAPAVALITVTSQPSISSGELFEISTSGSFSTKQPSSGDRRFPSFAFAPNVTFDRSTVKVDQFGRIDGFDAPNQLPYLAGPMALLTIHAFDPNQRSGWTHRQRITITIQESDSRFGGIRPPPLPRGLRPGGFRDPFAPREVRTLDAIETHQYRIVSDTAERTVLEKTFSLTTLDDDAAPYFNISGSGEVVFNRATGLVEEFTLTHRFEQNGDEKIRVPVRIKVEREAPAELARRKREFARTMAATEEEQARKKADEAAVVDSRTPDQRLNAVIETIRTTEDSGTSLSGQLDALARQPLIEERRQEVEGLLLTHLESSNVWTAAAAAKALGTWGSKDSTPAVLKALEHSNHMVAQAAATTLGGTGDKQVVQPLIKHVLRNGWGRSQAQKSLVQLGSVVEDDMITLLLEDDRESLRLACDILKDVGGEKSRDALQVVVDGEDFYRRNTAKRALDDVQKRIAVAATLPAGSADGETLTAARRRVILTTRTLGQPTGNGFDKVNALVSLGAVSPTDDPDGALETALLQHLDDINLAVELQSMQNLPRVATERSVPKLIEIACTPDAKTRSSAIALLERFASPNVSTQLAAWMADHQDDSQLFGVIRKGGIDGQTEQHLIRLLASPADHELAVRVADVLAEAGSPASLDALDTMAASDTPTTQQYAAARAAARIRIRRDRAESASLDAEQRATEETAP